MKSYIHETISSTDLVRHLSSVIDKVRMSGKSLYITKGTQTIAELSPPPKSGFPVNELAELLKSLPKLGDDITNMANDLKTIKNNAKMSENPWD